MQSIKYVLIVAICVSILLTNVSFAQETDNELSELLKYQTNLMKYQAEAKDPGMATLLGGVFGFGLGHHYVSGRVNVFTVGEAGGLIAIVVGANMKEEKVWGRRNFRWWSNFDIVRCYKFFGS